MIEDGTGTPQYFLGLNFHLTLPADITVQEASEVPEGSEAARTDSDGTDSESDGPGGTDELDAVADTGGGGAAPATVEEAGETGSAAATTIRKM